MRKMVSLGLRYENGALWILDQTELPHREVWMESRSTADMVGYIQRLAVRGAPLIGVAAALELGRQADRGASVSELKASASRLREARPTAVNLMAAVDRVIQAESVVQAAESIFDEDVALCEAMAARGAALIQDGDGVLTHCNTGGLATAGVGTALGVIRRAYEQGKRIHVFVDETRPLLQGARLTTWELGKLGIPHTLICDNMAAVLMAAGKIQKVFVGADRIAVNGDVANKIGTYSVAVNAAYHKVPFYVVAPRTTQDPHCSSGADIPIEQRDPAEVRAGKAQAGTPAWNPSFDVTPRRLITAIVLDSEVLKNG